ncbi:MAG: hypothetical protein N2B57_02945 [Planctomycetales bacterium]
MKEVRKNWGATAISFSTLFHKNIGIDCKLFQEARDMRYITLLFLTCVICVCSGETVVTQASLVTDNGAVLSRKQVTVHNCDSAGEALAEAESRNPGWTAYNAKNVSGRTWVVSMKQT